MPESIVALCSDFVSLLALGLCSELLIFVSKTFGRVVTQYCSRFLLICTFQGGSDVVYLGFKFRRNRQATLLLAFVIVCRDQLAIGVIDVLESELILVLEHAI